MYLQLERTVTVCCCFVCILCYLVKTSFDCSMLPLWASFRSNDLWISYHVGPNTILRKLKFEKNKSFYFHCVDKHNLIKMEFENTLIGDEILSIIKSKIWITFISAFPEFIQTHNSTILITIHIRFWFFEYFIAQDDLNSLKRWIH